MLYPGEGCCCCCCCGQYCEVEGAVGEEDTALIFGKREMALEE